jgi:hypothetical protein
VCIQKVGGVPLLDRPAVDTFTALGTASAGQAVPSAGPTSILPARSSGTSGFFRDSYDAVATNLSNAHTSPKT